MKNFAVISNEEIVNILTAKSLKDAQLVTNLLCVEYTKDDFAVIGGKYRDGVFIAPEIINETLAE